MSRADPTIVARRLAYHGWNRLEVLTVETLGRDGAVESVEREVIDHGGVMAVLPVDLDNRVALLARQWRAPLLASGQDPHLLEACAGLIDEGESAEEAAVREAREELGLRLRAEALRPAGSILPSPGALTECVHLFIAPYVPSDRVGRGGGRADEGEAIEIVEMGLDDLYEEAKAGRLRDAKTLVLVQRLMLEGA